MVIKYHVTILSIPFADVLCWHVTHGIWPYGWGFQRPGGRGRSIRRPCRDAKVTAAHFDSLFNIKLAVVS